jgi:phage baseplate assembly protein W
MANAPNFIGFSTIDRQKPPFTLTDFELVKADLLNHFSTKLGERVMLPKFGTIIYDLLMEPFDEGTRELIIQDATNVIASEPRVNLDDMRVIEGEHTIQLEMQLTYLPTGITEELAIQFDIDSQE